MTMVLLQQQDATSDVKALGAFYTDAQVAEFLVWWAVRSSSDTVSFGGGVFLRARLARTTQVLNGQCFASLAGARRCPTKSKGRRAGSPRAPRSSRERACRTTWLRLF